MAGPSSWARVSPEGGKSADTGSPTLSPKLIEVDAGPLTVHPCDGESGRSIKPKRQRVHISFPAPNRGVKLGEHREEPASVPNSVHTAAVA